MIRTVAALAALAITVSAAPAFAAPAPAADGVHVSLAGKSPAQIHADIVQAASKVCYAATSGQPLFVYVYPTCIHDSVKTAVAKIGNADLMAFNDSHPKAVAGR